MQDVYSEERPAESKAAMIYRRLREQIVRGDLDGQGLDEVSLARSLGASRTPLREAFQRLAQEGLIEIVPGRGAAVRRITVQDVREIGQLRLLLEPEAARMAAAHVAPNVLDQVDALLADPNQIQGRAAFPESGQHEADRRLHGLVLASCGNRRLRTIAEGLMAPIERLQIAFYPHRLAEAAEEHRRIVDRLRAGDGTGAMLAMRAHLEATQRGLMDLIVEQPGHAVVEILRPRYAAG